MSHCQCQHLAKPTVPANMEDYYYQHLDSETDASKKLGWESAWAHHRRFQVLLDQCDLEGKSILDVGSGLGELNSFLCTRVQDFSYTGIDILPRMVDEARKRFPCADFQVRNILEQPFGYKFSVVYCSGVFNLKMPRSQEFLEAAFDAFTNHAAELVAISLLSDTSPDKEDIYEYHDAAAVLADLGRPGWNLRIVEGYLPNDFTLIAERE